MKKLLIILIIIVSTGCQLQPNICYYFENPEARQCYFECKVIAHRCSTQCPTTISSNDWRAVGESLHNMACIIGCGEMRNDCINACSGVRAEECR